MEEKEENNRARTKTTIEKVVEKKRSNKQYSIKEMMKRMKGKEDNKVETTIDTIAKLDNRNNRECKTIEKEDIQDRKVVKLKVGKPRKAGEQDRKKGEQ